MIYVIKASTADQVNQLNHSLLKGADFGCQVENLIQE